MQEGGVLIVGVGNSGADIAIEVARTHTTWMSGKESGHIPFPIDSFLARFFLMRLVRFIGHHVLTVSTPIGRKLRPKMLPSGRSAVRVKPHDLVEAGIERVPRVVGVRNGRPLLADDRTLDVRNVIWCTGYHPGFSWIDLPIFGEDGEPMHDRGIVTQRAGNVLRRPAFPLLDDVGRVDRRRAGCRARRPGHRSADPRNPGCLTYGRRSIEAFPDFISKGTELCSCVTVHLPFVFSKQTVARHHISTILPSVLVP